MSPCANKRPPWTRISIRLAIRLYPASSSGRSLPIVCAALIITNATFFQDVAVTERIASSICRSLTLDFRYFKGVHVDHGGRTVAGSRSRSLRMRNPPPPSSLRRGSLRSATLSEGWWAWVDLNHRPHPYQLSSSNVIRRATVCYYVDFPRY